MFVIVAVALKLPAIPSLVGGVVIGVPFMFWNQAHVETALDDTLVNNVFSILNNGISMGNVPDNASDIINEVASLLTATECRE